MTLAALMPYIITFGLIVTRCTGLFMMVPMFGGEILPARIRVSVAVIVTVTLAPLVGPLQIDGYLPLFVAAAGELLLGLAMGLSLRLVLVTADFAGEVAGMQMGFSFSRVVDPMSSESTAVTSRVMGVATSLILIAIDGHHFVISGLEASLRAAPPGTVIYQASYVATLVPLLGLAFSTGLRIAAPVVVALLLTNCSIGLLARAAPQLNLFVFAFGISIAIGMLIFAAAITSSMTHVVQHLRQLPSYMAAVVGG